MLKIASIPFFRQAWQSSNTEMLPSLFEQDEAYAYCCKRKLLRPKTNILTLLKWLLFLELFATTFAFSVYFLFNKIDSFLLFSFEASSILRFYLLGNLIAILLFLRKILIIAVEIYQHYAPENVRRRCLYKPTCSEYTILSLQKYGVVIGLFKAYIRIFKKCNDNIYHRIDYP